MSIKSIIGIVIVALVVITGGYYVGTQNAAVRYGGVTNLDSLELTGSLTSGGVNSISATTGTSTRVMTQAEMYGYSVIQFTGSSTATNLLVLPASSTLTSIIPNAGDSIRYIIVNTSGTTTTLVGSTGTTLQQASTSAVVANNGSAILVIYRLIGSNVNAVLQTLAR